MRAGYRETPPGLPAWWEERGPSRRPDADGSTQAGSEPCDARRHRTTLPFPVQKHGWIEALLESPLFAAQRELVTARMAWR
jgi:hypothetical protein